MRGLGAFERAYEMWSGERPMHFCLVAELSGAVTPTGLELAPKDQRVRERIAGLLEAHGITEEQLASRLLTRAGLHQEKETP